MIARQTSQEQSIVYLIDDDRELRDGVSTLLKTIGLKVQSFGSTEEFLHCKREDTPGCLLLDVRLPGTSGLDLQNRVGELGIDLPIIFMTGYADVPMGVRAIKAGAVEFLCKPFREQDLLDAVQLAIDQNRNHRLAISENSEIHTRFESLTPREREVMAHVTRGLMNKQVAGKMGVSEVTVKVHRGSVMRKMGVRTLAELVRMDDVHHLNDSNAS